MNEHHVVVYVNAAAKTFSATARMHRARLPEVDDWAKKNGFSWTTIAANIDKANAEAMKKREIRRYKGQGYQYVRRPPL